MTTANFLGTFSNLLQKAEETSICNRLETLSNEVKELRSKNQTLMNTNRDLQNSTRTVESTYTDKLVRAEAQIQLLTIQKSMLEQQIQQQTHITSPKDSNIAYQILKTQNQNLKKLLAQQCLRKNKK